MASCEENPVLTSLIWKDNLLSLIIHCVKCFGDCVDSLSAQHIGDNLLVSAVSTLLQDLAAQNFQANNSCTSYKYKPTTYNIYYLPVDDVFNKSSWLP